VILCGRVYLRTLRISCDSATHLDLGSVVVILALGRDSAATAAISGMASSTGAAEEGDNVGGVAEAEFASMMTPVELGVLTTGIGVELDDGIFLPFSVYVQYQRVCLRGRWGRRRGRDWHGMGCSSGVRRLWCASACRGPRWKVHHRCDRRQ